jgi:hypothetical protein
MSIRKRPEKHDPAFQVVTSWPEDRESFAYKRRKVQPTSRFSSLENVLIHAPAKGATCQIDRQFRYQVIAKVFAIVIRRHKGWHRFGD